MIKFSGFLLLLSFFFPTVSYGEVIELNNGDILNVIIKGQTKNALLVEHASLGEISIDKGKIANLPSINLKSLAKVEDKKPDEEKPADEGLFRTGWLKDWDRSFDVGLSGASGSSDNTNFRAGTSFHFEDDKDRWDFKMLYYYSQEDDETTDNVLRANLLKDWFIIGSKWFYFAAVGYDWDEFKDWDYRIRIAGGKGYQFVKSDQWELATRLGLSGVYEVMDEEEDNEKLEATLGLHLSWNITEHQSLKLDNYLLPALTDPGEFRNVTAFIWTHKLDFYKKLAIKFGFNNEYDTTETDKNDLKYNASIAWEM